MPWWTPVAQSDTVHYGMVVPYKLGCTCLTNDVLDPCITEEYDMIQCNIILDFSTTKFHAVKYGTMRYRLRGTCSKGAVVDPCITRVMAAMTAMKKKLSVLYLRSSISCTMQTYVMLRTSRNPPFDTSHHFFESCVTRNAGDVA